MQDAKPRVCALEHRQLVGGLLSANPACVPVLGGGRRPPDAIQAPQTARAPSKRRFAGAQRGQERRMDAARHVSTAATMMQALGVGPDVIDRCQNHVLPRSNPLVIASGQGCIELRTKKRASALGRDRPSEVTELAAGCQTSVCSAISSASSTSMLRYRTVLSSLVWSSKSLDASKVLDLRL